jgi:hypothetical protein
MAGAVAIAAFVLLGRLDHGWWHHDDGSFAHSAERVLAGDLPHRDFADLYTGLLTFMNAAVFAVMGHDIANLRIPLFVAFLGFVACFFALSRRFVGPWWGLIATVFAIGWSVPAYPSPMPSWYMLFLSTFGLYAIVRYVEAGNLSWLFLAGLCGGVSITLKVVGIWYVAAALLAVLALPLFSEREKARTSRSLVYSLALTGTAVATLLLMVLVVSGRPTPLAVLGLFAPAAALCVALAWRGFEARSSFPTSDVLPMQVAALMVGVLTPIALLALPYVVTGSMASWFEGVFVAPRARYDFSANDGPSVVTLLRALPVVGVFLLRIRLRGRARLAVDVAAGTAMVFVAATAATMPSYAVIWGTTRALAPFVILLGAFLIIRNRWSQEQVDPRLVTLIVLVAGFGALIQFPFAAPIYFLYAAPLLLLAAIAVLKAIGGASGLLPAVVLIALAVFGIRQIDTQSVLSLGATYKPDPQVAILDSERASIRVLPETKAIYDRVLALVAAHRRDTDVIFAGPDAPEMYFLTQSRNPTASVMDFLDASGSTRGERLLNTLRDSAIRVVVLNHAPEQSPKLSAVDVARIRGEFPSGERAGDFEVRWRS